MPKNTNKTKKAGTNLYLATDSLESATLRATRAENVLTCQRAWRAYVLTYHRALRAYVFTRQRGLCTYILACQRTLHAHVLMYFTYLRAQVPACLQ